MRENVMIVNPEGHKCLLKAMKKKTVPYKQINKAQIRFIIKSIKDKSVEEIDKTVNNQFYKTYQKIAEIQSSTNRDYY